MKRNVAEQFRKELDAKLANEAVANVLAGREAHVPARGTPEYRKAELKEVNDNPVWRNVVVQAVPHADLFLDALKKCLTSEDKDLLMTGVSVGAGLMKAAYAAMNKAKSGPVINITAGEVRLPGAGG